MLFVDVVSREFLAQLSRRRAHNVIEVRVIRWVPAEDLNPNRAFLDLVRRPVQRHLNHVLQESDGALAGAKDLIPNQQVELRSDHLRGQFRRRPVLR